MTQGKKACSVEPESFTKGQAIKPLRHMANTDAPQSCKGVKSFSGQRNKNQHWQRNVHDQFVSPTQVRINAATVKKSNEHERENWQCDGYDF
jgi:hypothetical protein